VKLNGVELPSMPHVEDSAKSDRPHYLVGKTVEEACRVCRANGAKVVVYDYWSGKAKRRHLDGDWSCRVYVLKDGTIKEVRGS